MGLRVIGAGESMVKPNPDKARLTIDKANAIAEARKSG
jgi:hypothetical protein